MKCKMLGKIKHKYLYKRLYNDRSIKKLDKIYVFVHTYLKRRKLRFIKALYIKNKIF